MSNRAIYPGSFDPITYGHMDIIKRASALFDQVTVTVAKNHRKRCLFSLEERIAQISAATQDIANIRVCAFSGLLVDFAHKQQCRVIIRGIRTISDFDFEFQLAGMNRNLCNEIETLFLITDQRYHSLSSSLLKEIAACGQSISQFVPEHVASALLKKLAE